MKMRRFSLTLLVVLTHLTSMALPALWDTIPREKTTIPVPSSRPGWREEVQELTTRMRSTTKVDVFFLGSTVVSHLGEGVTKELWDRYFVEENLYALNGGIAGDLLENLLSRLVNGGLDFPEGQEPRVVVLLAGEENVLAGDDPQLIADGIRALIQLVRRRLPDSRIIVSGIRPWMVQGDPRASARRKECILRVNALVRAYTEPGMVTYVEGGPGAGKGVGQHAPNGKRLTPNGEEYRMWLEEIRVPLRKFLSLPPVRNLRIMPLGNSITSALSDEACYRRYLDHRLHREGLLFDLVGSRHWLRNESRRPQRYDYDWDHEGHWAREADWLLQRVGGYARRARPDLVLMHVGTNDILHEQGTKEQVVERTLREIGAIIDTLRAVNPNVRILVAQIIPTRRGGMVDEKIRLLNERLPWLVKMKQDACSPVRIVDQWTDLVPREDLQDNYHVNRQGALKMADKWYEAVMDILRVHAERAENIRLPSVIGSGMVLQRESKVPVWGWGRPGDTFTLHTSWDDHVYPVEVDAKGEWRTVVSTGPAGGPYRIELRSDSVIILDDVLLGEVWLCSGQSNMEMALGGRYGSMLKGSAEALATAGRKTIRLFQVKHATSRRREDDCQGAWEKASPEDAASFSAVGWYFGVLLQESLGVPVGLIQSTVGGTPVQAWTPQEYMKRFDPSELKRPFSLHHREALYPSTLYNAMINPLVPYRIKGVIWYQGESNRLQPAVYADLFSTMIRAWRKEWGYEMPFYFVQIAPYDYSSGFEGALIREAQLQVMLRVPHTGMAVTLDIGEEKNIHPGEKRKVGQRLAYWALARTYGMRGVPFTAPVYDSLEIRDTVAVVHFRYVDRGLYNPHKEIDGFEVAGADRIFHPAHAVVGRGRRTVMVWNTQVPHPVAVRYCFHNWCVGTLFGQNGLPVSSFRTDNWPAENIRQERNRKK